MNKKSSFNQKQAQFEFSVSVFGPVTSVFTLKPQI